MAGCEPIRRIDARRRTLRGEARTPANSGGLGLGKRSRLLGQLRFQPATDDLTKRVDRAIDDRIADLGSVLAPDQNARGRQRLQMTRDVGLRAAERGDKPGHISLTREQRFQEAQPHGFGQHGKPARHQFDARCAQRQGAARAAEKLPVDRLMRICVHAHIQSSAT